MSLSKRLKRAFRRVATHVAPGPVIVYDIAKGKKPEHAVRDAAVAPVENARKIAEAAVDVERTIESLTRACVERKLGEEARKVLDDCIRLARPLNPEILPAALAAFEQFLKTGELRFLDPTATLVASEIEAARNLNWVFAEPISRSLIASFPVEVRDYAKNCRVIDVDDVQALSLPSFAIRHLKIASAFTAIDLIFFRDIPDYISASEEDKHLWCHELFHVKQYEDMGLVQFVRAYLAEETGFHSPIETRIIG